MFWFCDLSLRTALHLLQVDKISNEYTTQKIIQMIVAKNLFKKSRTKINITPPMSIWKLRLLRISIKKNCKFVIFEVDQWVSLGDPFEVKVFEYWEDIF